MLIAANENSARELENVATALNHVTSEVKSCTDHLKSVYGSVCGTLGAHENQLQDVLNDSEKAQEALKDAIEGVPQKLNDKAAQIRDYLKKRVD
jgi:septation ring formation regulator EzrA